MATKKTTKSVSSLELSEDKPVAISIRFPRSVHEELRNLAFVERCSIHSIIMAGVEREIASRRPLTPVKAKSRAR